LEFACKSGKKGHNFLAQVLSSEDCWEKVNSLHEVKLNRHMLGRKLTVADSDNPFVVFLIDIKLHVGVV
jgi:hypothetical protein